MKRFCEIMVIVYIVLFIPATVYAKMFDLMSYIGIENANQTLAYTARYIAEYFPVILFASAGLGYAMNTNEKYNISRIILLIPVIAFAVLWICILMA